VNCLLRAASILCVGLSLATARPSHSQTVPPQAGDTAPVVPRDAGTAPLPADTREYAVAAARNRWNLSADLIECVSLFERPDLIFGKSYSNDSRVVEIAIRTLSGKSVKSHDLQCAYILTFVIELRTTRAVKYLGRPSTVSMSFDICERDSSGRVRIKACLSKNLYLFRSDLSALEVLELGLKAFLQVQKTEWEIIKVRL
jgi:hypothetical protein